jgi:hypothetical protein
MLSHEARAEKLGIVLAKPMTVQPAKGKGKGKGKGSKKGKGEGATASLAGL